MEPLSSLLPCAMLNVVDLSEFKVPTEILPIEKLLSLANSDIYSQVPSSVQIDHMAFIRALTMPTLLDIATLKERLHQYISTLGNEDSHLDPALTIQSINYTSGKSDIRLPLWILDYWIDAHKVLVHKRMWQTAISWLKTKKNHGAITALTEVPWTYNVVKAVSASEGMADLAGLCSTKWLSGSQMDTMLLVLDNKLQDVGVVAGFNPTHVIPILTAIYRHSRDSYTTSAAPAFLREILNRLASTDHDGNFLSTAVAVHIGEHGSLLPNNENISNHWSALIIDTTHRTIRYGDSMGHGPPTELYDVLSWWLQHAFIDPFTIQGLLISSQTDGYSCSVLTVNALEHFFQPSTTDLLSDNEACVMARIHALTSTIKFMKKMVCSVILLSVEI